jgi:hypothetical protein
MHVPPEIVISIYQSTWPHISETLIHIRRSKLMINNSQKRGRDLGPRLWSGDQSSWLQIQRSRARFPAQPDFLRSGGSGTGSTQPREYN